MSNLNYISIVRKYSWKNQTENNFSPRDVGRKGTRTEWRGYTVEYDIRKTENRTRASTKCKRCSQKRWR